MPIPARQSAPNHVKRALVLPASKRLGRSDEALFVVERCKPSARKTEWTWGLNRLLWYYVEHSSRLLCSVWEYASLWSVSNIFSLRRIINKNTVTHFRLNGRVGLEPLVVMLETRTLCPALSMKSCVSLNILSCGSMLYCMGVTAVYNAWEGMRVFCQRSVLAEVDR